jgi:hypothetical protein
VFLTSLYTNSGNLDLNENEVSEIYRSILSKALKVFKIGAQQPGSSKQTAKQSNPEPLQLAKLVKQCDAMCIEKTDIFEALLNCVRESFTQVLWCNILLPFISSLCKYLGEKASSSPISTEKTYITMLIDACLSKYVGTLPQRPTNWKRKFLGTCHCGDCQLLRKFIESPHEKDQCFRLALARRSHLARQLDDTFLTTTYCQGTPHTLKVEKTYKKYEADLLAWQKRVKRMQSELTSLADNTPFVNIIGDDQYKGLLKHECFENPRPAKSSNTHLGAPVRSDGGSGPVAIPKKRSFVNLSED